MAISVGKHRSVDETALKLNAPASVPRTQMVWVPKIPTGLPCLKIGPKMYIGSIYGVPAEKGRARGEIMGKSLKIGPKR